MKRCSLFKGGNLARAQAVLCFLLCLCVRFLIPGHSPREYPLLDLCAACNIILLAPVGANDSVKVSHACTWAAFLAALGLAGLTSMRPGRLLTLYPVLLFLPLCAFYTARVVSILRDTRYRISQVAGWDVLVDMIRSSFILYYFSLAAVVCCQAASGHFPSWSVVVSGILLSALCVLLMVRSVGSEIRPPEYLMGREPAGNSLQMPGIERIGPNYRSLYARMCEYMEEQKPYLKDNFLIDDMSHALYTNKGYLSKMINSTTGLNFPQLMNSYRIRHALELYKRDTKLKVSELSDMSGFHSTVSFTAAFNLFVGKNPSDWCKEYKDSLVTGKRPSTSGERGR